MPLLWRRVCAEIPMLAQRILIVAPAWVGDMVMAQCLFRLLKQQRPQVVLDVLAPASTFPLLARMPEVTGAILAPFRHGELALAARYRLGRSLRARHYAAAIVLPNSFKSALVPFWAAISVRTGFRGEMRYGVLNDLRFLDTQRYPLMIERFMALGLPANAALPDPYPYPILTVSSEAFVRAVEKQGLEHTTQPILALCPGAEFGAAKRWPAEYYADVAREKIREGWQVWLLGSPADRTVAEEIAVASGDGCINLAGKTKLEEAIDLLSGVTAVVTNDSGLMHVAAALNKPLIAVYGPTSPRFTPPLHPAAKVLQLSLACQPCFQRECPLQHHRCMRELTPSQVLAALQELPS